MVNQESQFGGDYALPPAEDQRRGIGHAILEGLHGAGDVALGVVAGVAMIAIIPLSDKRDPSRPKYRG